VVDKRKKTVEEIIRERDAEHQAARDEELRLQEKGKLERTRACRQAIDNIRRQDWGHKS
jgi:hypothetical protein